MSSASDVPYGLTRWLQEKFDASDKNTHELKSAITGISRGVTVLKGDLEGAKAAATAVAVGLTLIKADITAFKIDEKGIHFFGNQLKSWPWVDWSKRWERRFNEQSQRVSNQLTRLQDDVRDLDRLKSERDTTQRRRTNGSPNDPGNAWLLERERQLNREIRDLERGIREKQRSIKASVREIEQSKAKKKFEELAAAAKTAERNKTAVDRNYRALAQILDQADSEVGSLARSLSTSA
ncbi:hypothetical protein [Streptomyces sp. NPDC001843]|uniref:hypothetical protein n=1 Tax=Streptomyces sp. NPDC001843 TaxID=3364617 RepID=UPI0036C8B408